MVRQAAFLRLAQVHKGGHLCRRFCEVSVRFHLSRQVTRTFAWFTGGWVYTYIHNQERAKADET